MVFCKARPDNAVVHNLGFWPSDKKSVLRPDGFQAMTSILAQSTYLGDIIILCLHEEYGGLSDRISCVLGVIRPDQELPSSGSLT